MQASNVILDSMPPGDAGALRDILKPVHLEQARILFESGESITHVYFPTSAIISLVVTLSTGETVEAAMVGRDGIVGAAAALDGRISLSRAIVQLSGSCLECDIGSLKLAALKSEPLLSLLVRHEQTVYSQAQQSAACIATHHVEARLSRWMLRARDLSGSDTLPFTQEFLAEMLGVQRTSVSVVAHTLQAAGLIKYSRGRIQILNVDGLREVACECYETVRQNYELLLRSPRV
jgi:CRP-like cAMP-binding protein